MYVGGYRSFVVSDGTVVMLVDAFAVPGDLRVARQFADVIGTRSYALVGFTPMGKLRFIKVAKLDCGNCEFTGSWVTAEGLVFVSHDGGNLLVRSNGRSVPPPGRPYLQAPGGTKYAVTTPISGFASYTVCPRGRRCWTAPGGEAGESGQPPQSRIAFAPAAKRVVIATGSSPIVASGEIVRGGPGQVISYDLATGRKVSTHRFRSAGLVQAVWASPKGRAIVAFSSSETAFTSLDANGKVRWQSTYQAIAPILVGPKGIYFRSSENPAFSRGEMLALRLDGTVAWRRPAVAPKVIGPDQTLYVEDADAVVPDPVRAEPSKTLYALAPTDGRVRWTFPHSGSLAFGKHERVYVTSLSPSETWALNPSRLR